MLHKTLKATATATDQGLFTALAAAYSTDRDQEQIVPGAFETTIEAWKASEKHLPLHWNHSGQASDIIGSVDPASMKETADGLYVEGRLDLEDSETAREAWRSMKNNAVALSFGFLATKTSRDGDIVKLEEIDLFEISIVPAPANPDTRLLSLKSAEEESPDAEHQEETSKVEDGKDEEPVEAKSAPQDPLRKRFRELSLEIANGGMRVQKNAEPEPEPEPELPLDGHELRRRAFEFSLEIAQGK